MKKYIIVHRDQLEFGEKETTLDPCVIVGGICRSGSRMANGDPKSDSKATGEDKYYKQIYRGNQVVQCAYFSQLNITASQMLHPNVLHGIF